jgi:hypothetical protein
VGFNAAITVEDHYGNLETKYSGKVTVALKLNPGNATLGGTTTVAVANGVASFTGISISTAGNPYTLVATSGSLTSPQSHDIDVIVPQLVVTTQPTGPVTAGVGFPLVVTVETAQGVTDTSFSGMVDLAVKTGPNGATIGGTTTATISNGVATFSGVILDTIGSYVLVASSGNATPGDTNTIKVVAPQLVVTTQPTIPVTAGVGFPMVVTVETTQGTTDTAFSGTVDLTVKTGPNGALPIGGTITATVSNGVASFSGVILDTAGPYVLEASSANTTPGDTNTITVVAAPASKLLILNEPPASVQAGSNFSVVAGAEDPFGNTALLTGQVTIQIVTNPGNSTLGGATTITASGNQAAFGSLTLNKVGKGYVLQVSSGSLTPVSTSSITVTNAPASQLVIPSTGQPPASLTAGQPFSVTVDAEDPFGNLDPNYTGSVTLALANNSTTPILGTTTLSAVGGVASFSNLMIDPAGTYKLLVTSNPKLTSTNSIQFTVNPAAPAKLLWEAEPPGQVIHNATFGATINIQDQFGNPATNYNGNVSIAIDNNPNNNGASLGGTTTVLANSGVATFAISINKVGQGYTLQAAVGSVSSPASTTIDVIPIPAVSLEISTQPPTSIPVAQTFPFQVTALDQSGNPDPDFTGTVTISLVSGPQFTLGGPSLTATAVSGVASFPGLFVDTVGTGYSIGATSTGLTAATSQTFQVTPGPATQLVVSTEPVGSVAAGTSFGFVVSAEDLFGNVATSFNGSVAVSINSGPGGATLSGTTTATASNGVADISGLVLDEAGTYTLKVSGTGLSSATTTPLSVTPLAATQLTISPSSLPPSSVTAGVPFGFGVTALDPYGNVAASFSGSVTIALTGTPAGPLGGTLTATASQGQVMFSSLTLDTVSTNYVIQATSGSLTPATTNPIAVTPAAATKLEVSIQPPTTMTSGALFGLAITALDQFGNVATEFNGNVTIALSNNPGNATLSGPLTATATAGVANFHAYITTTVPASGYTLQATSSGLTPVTTGPIQVLPTPATHLVVLTQPPSVVPPGGSFGFVVAAEDASGNIAQGYNGQISITPASGSGAVLGGTTTAAAVNGEVTFSGLTITQANGPFSIQVSSTGLTGTTTSSVSVGSLAQLAFATGTTTVDSNAGNATIQLVRTGGYQGAVSVTVATSGGTAVAGVNYTPINQVVTFSAGQDSQMVTVPVNNYTSMTPDRSVNVVLSSPGVNAVLGSQTTTTLVIHNVFEPSSTSTSSSLVTLAGVQLVMNHRHRVTEILVGFSNGVNVSEAQNLNTYTLTRAGKRGSFTAKNARLIRLKSAVYSGTNATVTLKPRSPFALTKSVQLVVVGVGPSGLQDSQGNLIDGGHTGRAGSNGVVVLKRGGGVTIDALPGGPLAIQ